MNLVARTIAIAAAVSVGIVGFQSPVFAGKEKKSSSASTSKTQSELDIGAAAPMSGRKMMDVSGKELSLKSAAGPNGLLVIFSCNTCPFVIAWEGRYNQLAEQAKAAGIGMVVVNSNEGKRGGDDSLEAMKAHAAEKGYTMPYVVDRKSELANAFGASRTPHVFLFDKKLKLAYRGAIDDNSESPEKVRERYLSDAISAVGAGTEVAVKSTRSVGCSIKRS